MIDTRCAKRVYDLSGFHSHRCSREGKAERDGQWYCTQHDPDHVRKLDARKRAALKEKEDRDAERLAEAKRLCDAFGVPVAAYRAFSWASKDTITHEAIVIGFEDARALIERSRR